MNSFTTSTGRKYIHFIVIFSFLMNSFFGYAYVNLTIYGIPLNEILLSIGLLLCIPFMPLLLSNFTIIKPILLWSILFIPFVLWGVLHYGKWALRDASHLIEIWWIPLAIISFYQVKATDLKKYLNIFVILITIKIAINFIVPEGLWVIKGLHSDVDLLKSNSAGMAFVTNIAFWGYVVKAHKKIIIIPLLVLSIVLAQSRTGIFSILLMLLVYMLIMRIKFENFIKVTSIILVVLLLYSSLINIPQLREYTKFNKLLTIEEYYELMLSTTGESNTFEGSAEGVNKRIAWRNQIFKKAYQSDKIMLLGQGFGRVLTDFSLGDEHPVREPHNSYLSVFARTGIVGFLLWSIFHWILNYKVFSFLRRNSNAIKHSFHLKILLILYLSLMNMYVIALAQPGFENPYWAIPAFIVIGSIIYLYRKNQFIVKYEQYQNNRRHTLLESGSIH